MPRAEGAHVLRRTLLPGAALAALLLCSSPPDLESASAVEWEILRGRASRARLGRGVDPVGGLCTANWQTGQTSSGSHMGQCLRLRGGISIGRLAKMSGITELPPGYHPGVKLRANLKSISHRCHLFEVAFVWELTKETIHLPLGCLQGG